MMHQLFPCVVNQPEGADAGIQRLRGCIHDVLRNTGLVRPVHESIGQLDRDINQTLLIRIQQRKRLQHQRNGSGEPPERFFVSIREAIAIPPVLDLQHTHQLSAKQDGQAAEVPHSRSWLAFPLDPVHQPPVTERELGAELLEGIYAYTHVDCSQYMR